MTCEKPLFQDPAQEGTGKISPFVFYEGTFPFPELACLGRKKKIK